MKRHDARRLSATVALTMTLCATPAVAHAAESQEVKAPEAIHEDAALSDMTPGTEVTDADSLSSNTAGPVTPAATCIEKTSPHESSSASLSTSDSSADAFAAQTVPEAALEAVPETAAQTASEATPEATAEVVSEAAPEAAPLARADEEVYIPDENLHALIAETLKKEPDQKITQQDMAMLTKLVAQDTGLRNKKVFSIEGLQYAHNLEVLNLNENSVSDLTPISKLTNLTELRLVRNEVSDLSPIAQLTKLKILDFYYNHVTDISAVANLRDLEFLDMHACNRNGAIGSIEPLSGLTKLRYLSIESNQITDIGCLKDVAQSMADAVGNEPTDNPPTFLVRVNKIKDFTALKPLLNKEYVELGGLYGSAMDKVIVGTINQSSEAIEKHISAEGGTFEVDLPEILGFEDVDHEIAKMFGVESVKSVVLSDDTEGYSLEMKDGKALITVDPNVVGRIKNETIRIEIGYDGTDFSYFIPLNITQDVTYAVEQTNTKPGRVICFEPDSLTSSSDGSIRFSLNDAAGTAVELESVNVSFDGKARLGESQEGFVATNIQIEDSGFSFDLARKKDVSLSRGTYELRPTISFKVKGSDTTYTLPSDMFSIQNVAVTDTPTDTLETLVRFDLTKSNKDGSYTSDAISSEVPFDSALKVHYVTAYDRNGERLEEVAGDFDPMTLTFTKDQIGRLGYVVLSVSKKAESTSTLTAAAAYLDALQDDFSTSNLYPKLKLELAKYENYWTHDLEFDGWVEGDLENSPLAEAAYGTVEYRYLDQTGVQLPGKPHAAGTYGVQAYVPEGFDYQGLESGVMQFIIAQAQKPDEHTDTSDKAEGKYGSDAGDAGITKAAFKTYSQIKKAVPQTGDTTMSAAFGVLTAALAALASAFGMKQRNSR